MKKLKQWISGSIKVHITGWGSERLINLCKKNNITLYNFSQINEGYSFNVSQYNYKRIQSFNEKIKSNINVIDKYGLPNFFYKYKKRKIFLIGIIFCMLGIFIFSNYIWNITVYGNENYTEEEIIKEINKKYVEIGTSKDTIDCNSLEKKLREDFDNIAWISCEIKGTNLMISIEETIPTHKSIEHNEPCNIIAYKDAIITDIVINKGQRISNIGDEVKKNDILITGIVNITNEYDEIIETSYIPAKGEVWGIVEYKYNDSFELNHTNKTYTGKEQNNYSISIFNNQINLPKKDKLINYDTVTTYNKLKLFKNLYLPFGINVYTLKEYTINNTNYTSDEANKIAKERLQLYLDNLKKKGVIILENNVTINIENGVCISSGVIKCKEVIGIPSPIEVIQKENSN